MTFSAGWYDHVSWVVLFEFGNSAKQNTPKSRVQQRLKPHEFTFLQAGYVSFHFPSYT